MRQPKDGDIMLITSGEAAGCLAWRDDFGGGRCEECGNGHTMPYFLDSLGFAKLTKDNQRKFLVSENWMDSFPTFEIIGRWK